MLPYPPFKYGSGMWVRDISREEAEALGVLEPGAPAPDPAEIPSLPKVSSISDLSEDLRAALLDSMPGASFENGVLTLKNSEGSVSSPFSVFRLPLSDSLTIANYDPGQPRDSLGRWVDSNGGGLPERHNIARGKRAMRRAIRQQKNVPKAMYRKGLGQVDFEWGTPGVKAENWDHGAGISHMRAKHPRDLYKIPEAIAKGKIMRHPRESDKRLIRHDKVLISIKKKNSRSSWVVTGYKED